MAAEKFKVGDRVRVRKWEDMEREYGVDCEWGHIKCPGSFVDSMIAFCGKEAVIKSKNNTCYALGLGWEFTDEMLEPITPAPRWYVGQSVWDDVLFPGETGKVIKIYTELSKPIEVEFKYSYPRYTDGGRKGFDYKPTLSAVPYTFSLPPQPEPVWIPEKWERVLVRDSPKGTWWAMAFDRYENGIYYAGQPDVPWKYCIQFDPDKVGKV